MVIFCTIYYVLSYIQTIPQVVKLIRTKSSNDYSLGKTLLGFIGLTCWTIYIFTSTQKMLVYIGTAVDMALLILVDFLILHYYKFNKDKKEPKEVVA